MLLSLSVTGRPAAQPRASVSPDPDSRWPPSAGVPGVLAALSLSFLSNLFGSITHYGSGQAAVYIGSGYLELKDVFLFGALFSVINLTIWGGVGSIWWKALGLY